MAYQDIATVNISLQGAGVTIQGFGTPLFASSHRYFKERVRTYNDIDQVASDIPTEAPAYQAAEAFFSNTPSPASIKIGRREASLDITVASASTQASFTLFASDGVTNYNTVVNVTGQADANAVASAIDAAITADVDVSSLVVNTVSTNVVSIDVANPNYTFWIQDLSSNLSESYTTVETAADLIVNLSLEDDDYYFFTADDHSDEFVEAASEAIESRTKMYFFSTQDVTCLTPYIDGSSTDILGKIRSSSVFRTKGFFHQDADTDFPECLYVGYNAGFDAGSITWTNLQVALSGSKNPSLGILLSSTEKGYLEDRNAAYVDRIGGLSVIRNGQVAQGERIDSIRGRDNLEVDLDAAYTNFLISQQGSKVPYNDIGISQLEGICRNVLGQYVVRGFINANYVTDFPRESDVPVADKASRIYQQGKFSAELSGAIELVRITGVLSLDL